jgi:4-amino-4-deoxy-L-arabinose transferase-like glycosyltransferase
MVKQNLSRQGSKSKTGGRSQRSVIFSLGILALLVRLLYTYLFSKSVLWQGIWSDSATYNQWARRIVTNGDWLGTEPFFMAPLYPYFLAGVYTIFGESLVVLRILQSILGAATCVLIFLIGDRMFSSRRVGLAAGLLACFYGPFFLSHNLLLTETLKVFLLTFSTWLFLEARKRSGLAWWMGGGLALGGAMLCRASDALVLIAVEAWILWFTDGPFQKRVVRGVVVAGAIVALILPVTIRNYLVSNEFILITSNGGLNFYLGNNSQAVGRYYNVDRLDLANDPDGRVYLETSINRNLRQSEVSSIWFSKAMEFILHEPGDFLALLVRKMRLFFHHKEISQLGYNYAFVSQTSTPVLGFMPGFLVAGPLGILGAVLAFRKWRTSFLLHSLLLAQVLSVVLFFVTDRFRLSAMPFFLLFAGSALVFIIEQVRPWNLRALIGPGVVLVVSALAMTTLAEDIPDEFSLEWEQVGTLYFNTGNHDYALKAYRNAAAYRDSYHLHNSIGNVLLATGRIDEAMEQFRQGHALHPGQPASTFNLGTAYVRRQDWVSALMEFDKALAINPRFPPAHLNKGLTLYYLQRFPEALESLRRYTELEPDKSKLGSVYGDIRNLEQILKQESTSLQ